MDSDAFKKCSFCSENIRKEAIKCRYCGEWLEEPLKSQSEPKPDPPLQIPAPIGLSKSVSSDLSAQMSEKTSDELLDMFKQPEDWRPEVLDVARAELQKRGLDPSSIVKSETQLQIAAPERNQPPPKYLFLFSIGLLVSCITLLVLALSSGHWSKMSPENESDAIANIVAGLFKIILAAVIFTFFVKRKGYKLFTFSVVCTISFLIGTYYFLQGEHELKVQSAETNKAGYDNLNTVEIYFKQGMTGDFPVFKPTGDPAMDSLFQSLSDFYKEFMPSLKTLNQSINSEQDVSTIVLQTNKLLLESEIQKRMAAQQLIEEFSKNSETLFEHFKMQYDSTTAPADIKRGVGEGINNLIPKSKAVCNALTKSQKSEEEFLRFLDDNFRDYQIQNGDIFFDDPTNEQRYSDLAKAIDTADQEVQNLRTQFFTKMDADKSIFSPTN